jgi:hypothetical protein
MYFATIARFPPARELTDEVMMLFVVGCGLSLATLCEMGVNSHRKFADAFETRRLQSAPAGSRGARVLLRHERRATLTQTLTCKHAVRQ